LFSRVEGKGEREGYPVRTLLCRCGVSSFTRTITPSDGIQRSVRGDLPAEGDNGKVSKSLEKKETIGKKE